MNFVEGTRFTPAKHAAQRSPYKHLLKPKAGGLAMALQRAGRSVPLAAGRDHRVPRRRARPSGTSCAAVRVARRPIPHEFSNGAEAGSPQVRKRVKGWLHELWQHKDEQIEALLRSPG
jgi:hypothetical protein